MHCIVVGICWYSSANVQDAGRQRTPRVFYEAAARCARISASLVDTDRRKQQLETAHVDSDFSFHIGFCTMWRIVVGKLDLNCTATIEVAVRLESCQ